MISLEIKKAGFILFFLFIFLSCGCISVQKEPLPDMSRDITVLCAGDNQTCNRFLSLIPSYTEKTGITVEIVTTEKESFGVEFSILEDESAGYDLIIMNQSDMAFLAKKGYICRLDGFMDGSDLNRTLFEWPPLMQYGEYPAGSSQLYALPFDPDVLGIVYRQDLFSDPDEQRAFINKYGYDLDKPGTYQNLSDIAEFFTRPKDGLYGIAFPGSEEGISLFAGCVLLSFGGEFMDPITGRTEGILDSLQNEKALHYFSNLSSNSLPDILSSDEAYPIEPILSGDVVMAVMPFSSFESLVSSAKNTNQTGFMFSSLPGEYTGKGSFQRRGIVLGESIGIGMNSGKKDAAWELLRWFYLPDTQFSWAVAGGQPARESVQDMPAYYMANPYNFCFPTSLRIAQDPWRTFNEKEISSIFSFSISKAVSGALEPKEALMHAAKEIDTSFYLS
ncbi:MAG: extracellular solute-binding protein [Methanospirillaceae archaeon]|nr:extracellular solute-binding protein [Methanospirillaceae archaeon]